MVVLAALFAALNARFLRVPHPIGLTIMGAICSVAAIAASRAMPGLHIHEWARRFVTGLDFRKTLLEGFLSFLLFAGAFQIDSADMRGGRVAMLALATFGTLLSTALVGFGLLGVVALLGGPPLPLGWCLVFGALISPTDPVAVIAILKQAWLPKRIQATVAAESLFNDGIGVVVFTILLAAATGSQTFSVVEAVRLFVQEAIGGALFGGLIGMIAYWILGQVADFVAELLITLAVVMGGYAAANALNVSGPVAMAVAGLIMGNQGVRYALSARARDYVIMFWEAVDEILNAVLFLLVGLEAIAISTGSRALLVAGATIPLVLLARLVSVGLPLLVLKRVQDLGRAAVPVLWWGGLRGGISIALALSIPQSGNQELILTATYAVVFFSVIVQGATIGRLARRFRPEETPA